MPCAVFGDKPKTGFCIVFETSLITPLRVHEIKIPLLFLSSGMSFRPFGQHLTHLF